MKLTAIVASSGASIPLDVTPQQTGEELKQKLAIETSISMKNQILFTEEGVRIRGGAVPLSYPSYNLIGEREDGGDNSRPQSHSQSQPYPQLIMFVFDREYIKDPTQKSEDSILDIKNFKWEDIEERPLTEEQSNNHPLSQSPLMLVKMLPTFQNQFDYHQLLATRYVEHSETRMAACEQCFQQLSNQHKALKVLSKHLDSLSQSMDTDYKEFNRKFEEQFNEHTILLQRFEDDLKKLSEIELDETLQKPTRKTLLDCVPEGSLRQWHQKCRQTHDQLQSKVHSLHKKKQDIDDHYQKLCNEMSQTPFGFDKLTQDLTNCQTAIAAQKDIQQKLHEDLGQIRSTITNAVEELKGGGLSLSTSHSPTRFDQMNGQHNKKLIPRLKVLSQQIDSVLVHYVEAQESMINSFGNHVMEVAEVQKSFIDESHTVTALSESLTRKQELFDQLIKVNRLPTSYAASVEEVVRQRAFALVLVEQTQRVGSGLKDARQHEMDRRMTFLHSYGSDIPSDLVPGLANKPGLCEVRYQHVEQKLPPIDQCVSVQTKQVVTVSDVMNELRTMLGNTAVTTAPLSSSTLTNEQHKKQMDLAHHRFEKEKDLALEMQKREYAKEVEELRKEKGELERLNNDFKFELDNYKIPDAPSFSSAQVSRMFNIHDPNVSSRISQYMSHMSRVMSSQQHGIDTMDADAIVKQMDDCDGMREELSFLQKEKESVEADAKLKRDELRKRVHDNEQLQHQLDEMELRNMNVQQRNKELQDKLDNVMLEHQDQYRLMDSKMKEDSSELQQYKLQIDEIGQAYATSNNATQQLRAELQQCHNGLQTEKDKNEQTRLTLLAQIKESTEHAQELEQKLDDIVREKEDVNARYEQFSHIASQNVEDSNKLRNKLKSYVCITAPFEAEHLLLFMRVDNVHRNPQQPRQQEQQPPSVYRALLCDSELPVILNQDQMTVAQYLKSAEPDFVVGQVVYSSTMSLESDKYNEKKGTLLVDVTATSFRKINVNFDQMVRIKFSQEV